MHQSLDAGTCPPFPFRLERDKIISGVLRKRLSGESARCGWGCVGGGGWWWFAPLKTGNIDKDGRDPLQIDAWLFSCLAAALR